MSKIDERFHLPDWVKDLPEIDLIISGRRQGKTARIIAGLLKQNADLRAKLEKDKKEIDSLRTGYCDQYEKESCKWVSDYTQYKKVKQERDNLQATLEAKEKDNKASNDYIAVMNPLIDKLDAANAVLREALGKYTDLMELSGMAAQYGGKLEDKLKFAEKRDAIAEEMTKALDSTPAEAGERVQWLVTALEELARLGGPGGKYGNSIGNVIAQDALAKYRGGKENG